jgi:hypothetical protein
MKLVKVLALADLFLHGVLKSALGHCFSACHVQILKAIEMVTDAIHNIDRAKECFGNMLRVKLGSKIFLEQSIRMSGGYSRSRALRQQEC